MYDSWIKKGAGVEIEAVEETINDQYQTSRANINPDPNQQQTSTPILATQHQIVATTIIIQSKAN